MLSKQFFDQEPCSLAKTLLGKVIYVKQHTEWLSAIIIETEAYYLEDKASHSSLGFTEKRKALFMPAGTIYMYYARGGDSLNISAHGEGNAVLIKSAYPYIDHNSSPHMLSIMQQLNPAPQANVIRPIHKLCCGQTLLCKALGLRVKCWDQQQFTADAFYIKDTHYHPHKIIQSRRLGIPLGRDEHLLYRFIDYTYAEHCTSNPLRKRNWQLDVDYRELPQKNT